jgi:hypothetical protein
MTERGEEGCECGRGGVYITIVFILYCNFYFERRQ